uniref:Uncharacterized protein n=1 Tax=Tanacetum cinerariifolium TaxID=118510 RepID=A0A6L2MB16_TANCI|nr:hypothetical protein [Tanacetum cinerariifolium]
MIMPEHQSEICVIFTMTMEILLEPTSNKLLVGDVGDCIWIELMTLDINHGLRTAGAAVKLCQGDSSEFYLIIGSSDSLRNVPQENVDFAYLLWEDFVYQVDHKDVKKSNEMYYPRFIKVIIYYFMTKDPSIPRRNKFGVMLHVKLTNEDIKNSKAYKEYYAVASGAAPPKTKASVRKIKSSFDTTITPSTAAGTRLLTSAKGKQPAKASKAKDKRIGIIPGVPDVPTKESDEEISWKSSDEDDDDDQDDDDQDEGNDDDQDTDNDGNDDASLGLNVGSKEGHDAEDDDDELYRDVNINLEGRDSSSVSSKFVTSMLNLSPDAGIDSLFKTTPRVDVQASTIVVSLTLTAPTLLPPTIPTSSLQQAPTPLTTALSTFSISSIPGRVVSSIPGIVERYMDQRINEAVKVAIQIQFDRLQDEAQAENEKFLKNLDDNIQKIIKEQVKEQVKKALFDAYESNKIILNTYGDTVTLKRSRDDADKDEEPFAGSDRGSKRRRKGKKLESTRAPKEKATKTTGKSTQGSKSHQKTTSEFIPAKEPMQTTQDLKEPSHQEFEIGLRVIPFDHFINNDLEYLRDGAFSRKYTTSVTKTTVVDYGHIKWIKDLVPRTMWSQEPVRDDDKLYNFKEGDFKRLRIQDIEDIMFTRSIAIQQRVEDLQLGVERYQKKLNLTKPNTLMRIDELHKFSDGTLNDVRTALDDRLKGIRMKYLPQDI